MPNDSPALVETLVASLADLLAKNPKDTKEILANLEKLNKGCLLLAFEQSDFSTKALQAVVNLPAFETCFRSHLHLVVSHFLGILDLLDASERPPKFGEWMAKSPPNEDLRHSMMVLGGGPPKVPLYRTPDFGQKFPAYLQMAVIRPYLGQRPEAWRYWVVALSQATARWQTAALEWTCGQEVRLQEYHGVLLNVLGSLAKDARESLLPLVYRAPCQPLSAHFFGIFFEPEVEDKGWCLALEGEKGLEAYRLFDMDRFSALQFRSFIQFLRVDTHFLHAYFEDLLGATLDWIQKLGAQSPVPAEDESSQPENPADLLTAELPMFRPSYLDVVFEFLAGLVVGDLGDRIKLASWKRIGELLCELEAQGQVQRIHQFLGQTLETLEASPLATFYLPAKTREILRTSQTVEDFRALVQADFRKSQQYEANLRHLVDPPRGGPLRAVGPLKSAGDSFWEASKVADFRAAWEDHAGGRPVFTDVLLFDFLLHADVQDLLAEGPHFLEVLDQPREVDFQVSPRTQLWALCRIYLHQGWSWVPTSFRNRIYQKVRRFPQEYAEEAPVLGLVLLSLHENPDFWQDEGARDFWMDLMVTLPLAVPELALIYATEKSVQVPDLAESLGLAPNFSALVGPWMDLVRDGFGMGPALLTFLEHHPDQAATWLDLLVANVETHLDHMVQENALNFEVHQLQVMPENTYKLASREAKAEWHTNFWMHHLERARETQRLAECLQTLLSQYFHPRVLPLLMKVLHKRSLTSLEARCASLWYEWETGSPAQNVWFLGAELWLSSSQLKEFEDLQKQVHTWQAQSLMALIDAGLAMISHLSESQNLYGGVPQDLVFDQLNEANLGFSEARDTLLAVNQVQLSDVLEGAPPHFKSEFRGIEQAHMLFFGAQTPYLDTEGTQIWETFEVMTSKLITPDGTPLLQDAVGQVIPPLLKVLVVQKKVDPHTWMTTFWQAAMKGTNKIARRGGATGLAALCSTLRHLKVLQTYELIPKLKTAFEDKSLRLGVLQVFEGLSLGLGRVFEAYLKHAVPLILQAMGDVQPEIRGLALKVIKTIFKSLSAFGTRAVLPPFLEAMSGSPNAKTQAGAIHAVFLLTKYHASELAQALPKVVPHLAEAVSNPNQKVKDAATKALNDLAGVVENPEIHELRYDIIESLINPGNTASLHQIIRALSAKAFSHSMDAPSIAILSPILTRALKDRNSEIRGKAAQAIGSLGLLTADKQTILPFMKDFLGLLQGTLLDTVLEVRKTTGRAFGTLFKELQISAQFGDQGTPLLTSADFQMHLGPDHPFAGLMDWLFQNLTEGQSSVERAGAANGLSEIWVALGKPLLEALWPKLLRSCTLSEFPAKEGYTSIFEYLPEIMKADFLEHLGPTFEVLLDGTSHILEDVRNISYRGAHCSVLLFQESQANLLAAALMSGLKHIHWQSRLAALRLHVQIMEALLRIYRSYGQDFLGARDMPMEFEERTSMLATLYIMRYDPNAVIQSEAHLSWKVLVNNTNEILRAIQGDLMTNLRDYGEDPWMRIQVSETVAGLCTRLPEMLGPLKEARVHLSPLGQVLLNRSLMVHLQKATMGPYLPQVIAQLSEALISEDPQIREYAGETLMVDRYRAESLQKVMPTLLADSSCGLPGLRTLLKRDEAQVVSPLLDHLFLDPTPEGLKCLAALADVEANSVFSKVVPQIFQLLSQTVFQALQDGQEPEIPPVLSRCSPDDLKFWVQTSGDILRRGYVLETHKTDGTSQIFGSKASTFLTRQTVAHLLVSCFQHSSKLGALVWDRSWLTDLLRFCLYANAREDDCPQPDVSLPLGAQYFQLFVDQLPKEDLLTQYSLLSQALQEVVQEWLAHTSYKDGTKYSLEVDTLSLPEFPQWQSATSLKPWFEVFSKVILNGGLEERVACVQDLRKLVVLAAPQAWKPWTVKFAGPLIRVVGDRFPATLKVPIIEVLSLLLKKDQEESLKLFLPQLQVIYGKCCKEGDSHTKAAALKGLQTLMGLPNLNDKLRATVEALVSEHA